MKNYNTLVIWWREQGLRGCMRIFITVLMAGLLAAPVAMAQNVAPAPSGADAAPAQTAVNPMVPETQEVTGKAPNPLEKISCIASDPPTGSRLGAHKTCHTQAQWNNIHANSAAVLADMGNRFENAENAELLKQGQ